MVSSHQFNWDNKEANFGLPERREIDGGTHFTVENILRYKEEYVALRRPDAIPGHQAPPDGRSRALLYFVHGLPRWGERLSQYVERVILEQTGVGVIGHEVLDLEMQTYPDEEHSDSPKQWAITLYTLVELNKLPTPGIFGNEISEVITFTADNIPNDFGWWAKEELSELLSIQ